MTVLFEMPIQMGGDPGDFSECAALRSELGKMNHPARPDVDWAQIELWCLALFRANGAELQTAACYALACGQRSGLAGLVRGMVLIEALVREWTGVWPPQPEARLAMLDWLFEHCQPLLRRMQIDMLEGQALAELQISLEQLHQQLTARMGAPSSALDALCRQVLQLSARVEPERRPLAGGVLLGSAQPLVRRLPELIPVVPVLPVVERKQTRFRAWMLAAAVLLAVVAGSFAVWHRVEERETAAVVPAPLQLSSLSLFDAGSAQLRPDSTKMLVDALVSIKAQPGWLIVISGHADGTGDAGRNQQLSRDRALAVKTWMQSMGDFPDSCFAIRGWGAGQPVASDLDETGRAANRRVDIRLVPQEGSCVAQVADANS